MSVTNKLEETKKELEGIGEVMRYYGLFSESKQLREHITFLYEVIEDRTKDIMHLHNLLDNQKVKGKADER